MALVTYTATLPNGVTVNRMSKVNTYVAIVAVAPADTDDWTVADWYQNAKHAEGIVRGTDIRYWPAKVSAKVIAVEITKVVGKTTDPALSAVKAALAAGR